MPTLWLIRRNFLFILSASADKAHATFDWVDNCANSSAGKPAAKPQQKSYARILNKNALKGGGLNPNARYARSNQLKYLT